MSHSLGKYCCLPVRLSLILPPANAIWTQRANETVTWVKGLTVKPEDWVPYHVVEKTDPWKLSSDLQVSHCRHMPLPPTIKIWNYKNSSKWFHKTSVMRFQSKLGHVSESNLWRLSGDFFLIMKNSLIQVIPWTPKQNKHKGYHTWDKELTPWGVWTTV